MSVTTLRRRHCGETSSGVVASLSTPHLSVRNKLALGLALIHILVTVLHSDGQSSRHGDIFGGLGVSPASDELGS